MAKSNVSLRVARNAKNDEFYTRYEDIAREIDAYYEYDYDVFRDKTVLCPCDDPEWSNFTRYFVTNFQRLGLKKLISTSYAHSAGNRRLTLCEKDSPHYDADKHATHGKVFTLAGNGNGKTTTGIDDTTTRSGSTMTIEFSGYLEGDGDFRSDEVTALRDEADVIITNPPFSLFRDFLRWVTDGNKQFAIIGNMNAITYKEVFPLIRNGKVWLGTTKPHDFVIPNDNGLIDMNGNDVRKFGNICWYTDIDHGQRHKPLQLMTMEQNLESNKRLRRRLERDYGKIEYPHYDNYDAIEIPFVECIPSDYDGVMGVPITFMDKYAPCQFEIVGATESEGSGFSCGIWHERSKVPQPMVHDRRIYKRIFIRPRNRQDDERPSQKVSGQAWDGTGREHGDVMSKRLASLADNTMEDGMR